jgi:tRNA (cmo5U34)-methyltransferase
MQAKDAHLEGSSLGHVPEGRWAFDEAVTAVFTDMLSRSIPQYGVMRKAVFDLGMSLVKPATVIVDLGCSKGDGLAPFVDALGPRNRYLGVDVSQPMLAAARQRFRDEIAQGCVTICDLDLRNGYPAVESGLTLCILSLQFTPIEHRQRILSDAFASTTPGGAFILVEKILGSTAGINGRMVDIYHDYKREAGYTAEEVERKKLSLEGVLVPVTARWNEEFLHDAGFREVDCFWRWMNFAGWIATK